MLSAVDPGDVLLAFILLILFTLIVVDRETVLVLSTFPFVRVREFRISWAMWLVCVWI